MIKEAENLLDLIPKIDACKNPVKKRKLQQFFFESEAVIDLKMDRLKKAQESEFPSFEEAVKQLLPIFKKPLLRLPAK